MENLEIVKNLVDILEGLKAKNVEALDISQKSRDIKVLIIASFKTEDEVKLAASSFIEQAKALNLELIHKDGLTKGQWVVLDYVEILIEIFYEPLREKYNLEKLWKDGKNKLFEQVKVKAKKPVKSAKKW